MHGVTVTETSADGAYPNAVYQATAGRSGRVNVVAATAASNALREGKSLDEAFQSATEAFNQDVLMDDESEYEPEDLKDEVQEAADAFRKYLLSVCKFGRGEFDLMNNDELLDIACLVQQRVPDITEWSRRRRRE